MLNLSRKNNQVICIGDDIQIKVLGIKGGQVRLGIDAPHDVAVHREEIYLKIQQEKATQRTFETSSCLFDTPTYAKA